MKDLLENNDGINRNIKRTKGNGEVFTPFSMCNILLNRVELNKLSNPKITFCDPTCGNGQIIISILEKRINSGIKPIDALKTLYGVELMQDNVDLCKERIKQSLREHGVKINKDILEIIDHNFVCSDFFEWDFENWQRKLPREPEPNGLDDIFY